MSESKHTPSTEAKIKHEQGPWLLIGKNNVPTLYQFRPELCPGDQIIVSAAEVLAIDRNRRLLEAGEAMVAAAKYAEGALCRATFSVSRSDRRDCDYAIEKIRAALAAYQEAAK